MQRFIAPVGVFTPLEWGVEWFTPTFEWGGVICPQQQNETKEETKEWERRKFYNILLFGNAQYHFGKGIYHILWLFPKKPQDAVFFAFSLQIFATFLKIFQKNTWQTYQSMV